MTVLRNDLAGKVLKNLLVGQISHIIVVGQQVNDTYPGPGLAEFLAMAFPMPLAPPVMTATLFSNIGILLFRVLVQGFHQKLTGRNPSLQESMADFGFFIQPS